MLTYLTTNLFDSPAQTLVNPVNTVGVMGKGLALGFKQRYPQMFQAYRQQCQAGDLTIGTLHIYPTSDKIIVNFPTKKHWRNPSRLEYVEVGLEAFVATYQTHGITSVSFPQLGCGYGGLSWKQQVEPLLVRYLAELPLAVYLHVYSP